MGTPAFMSPEQAMGRVEEVDKVSDVYCLGAILYSLLAGHSPYIEPKVRVSPRTVLARVLEGPPKKVNEIARDANAELVAICEKAMARDKPDRYESALAMSEDLQAWIDGRVVRAYESGTSAELRKWVSRNRYLAASIAAATLLLFAGLTSVLFVQLSANSRLKRAYTKLDNAQSTITAQLHESQVNEAELMFSKGLELAERGEVDLGMMWMAETLSVVPDSMKDFESMVRRNLAGWSQLLPRMERNWLHQVSYPAFSPDGSFVAIGGVGDGVQVIDTATGKPIRDPYVFEGNRVTAIDFHPEKTLIALGISDAADTIDGVQAESSVVLFDFLKGKPVGEPLPHKGRIHWVAFSKDGESIITHRHPGTFLQKWDLSTGP